MPRIVNRLAAAETTAMLADDRAVLADHDAIGVSLDPSKPRYGLPTQLLARARACAADARVAGWRSLPRYDAAGSAPCRAWTEICLIFEARGSLRSLPLFKPAEIFAPGTEERRFRCAVGTLTLNAGDNHE